MKRQRVLIVEDHAILREGLRALLSTASDLEIAGEATDGREAIRSAVLLKPDLILMDLSMPHLNGTEAIMEIKRREPEIKIIVLTVHNTEEYVRATFDAGADGYVLKEDTHADLLTAVKKRHDGENLPESRNCQAGGTRLSRKDQTDNARSFLGHSDRSRTRTAKTHRRRQQKTRKLHNTFRSVLRQSKSTGRI